MTAAATAPLQVAQRHCSLHTPARGRPPNCPGGPQIPLTLPFCRGNSKYHYYGLRIKAGSPLLRLVEDQQHLAMRQQPFAQKQR